MIPGGEMVTEMQMTEACFQLSVARTPQQNGIVITNNRTVQEMARTMLMDSKLTDIFWT
jgi:hypothetical protein